SITTEGAHEWQPRRRRRVYCWARRFLAQPVARTVAAPHLLRPILALRIPTARATLLLRRRRVRTLRRPAQSAHRATARRRRCSRPRARAPKAIRALRTATRQRASRRNHRVPRRPAIEPP